MQFVADRLKLLTALSRVACAVDKGGPHPILSHVHLQCADGKLQLRTTDMVLSAAASLPVQQAKPGEACVPVEVFEAALRRRAEAAVRVTVEKLSLSVDAEGSRRKSSGIGCMPGEDFPNTVTAVPAKGHTAATVLGVLAEVAHAAAKDDTRPHLCAINLLLGEGKVRAVATDGHRLAVSAARLESATEAGKLLLPRPFVDAIRARPVTSFADEARDGKRWIVAWGEDFSVRAQPVDSAFPAYEQVIPGSHAILATTDRGALADALAAAADAVGKTDTCGVVLSLAAGGPLSVRTDHPDRGQFEDAVDAQVEFEGAAGEKPFRIGFNGKYLREALASIGGDRAQIEFTGELDPAVVRSLASSERLDVLMPMRV